jgi:hypothetical protein
LVKALTKGVHEYDRSITEEHVEDVLSCLYWGAKNGNVSPLLMVPKDVAKFREPRWYITEPYNTFLSMTEAVYDLIVKVLKVAVKAVEVVISGIDAVLDLTAGALTGTIWVLKNLPYILAGGAVLIAG